MKPEDFSRMFAHSKAEGIKSKQNYPLHLALFAFTFLTCMIAGAQWAYKDFTDVLNWHYGLTYASLIIFFLSAHEFGHYFAARYHKVDATLPYYIPFPIPLFVNFGTFGAVIKTRAPILSRTALFDIGAAGPIAGFIVCIFYLIYGFATLPPIDFLYNIHPEYLKLYGGAIPETSLHFGDTLLYWLLADIFANPNGFLPPMNEIYHYPFLNVGWFGLFVTCLNLLPIGQLDGGHIVYAMFGEKHSKIARIAWKILLVIGLFSLLPVIYDLLKFNYPNGIYIFLQELLLPPLEWVKANLPIVFGLWQGWLVWAVITRFFIKLDHAPVPYSEPISKGREVIGWACFGILLLCFSYNGIYFVE